MRPPELRGEVRGLHRVEHPPMRDQAQGLGCTCQWFGNSSIAEYNFECPILGWHHVPRSMVWEISITVAARALSA